MAPNDMQSLVDFGTIAQDDVDSLFFTDDAVEAYKFLVSSLSKGQTSSAGAAWGDGMASLDGRDE